jgi:hypothetical protein
MKILIISVFLFLIPLLCSKGQWYQKKYQVNNIHALSKGQLEESLDNSKKDLLISSFIFVVGGGVYLVFKYLKPGMGDDPSTFEQLMGDDGMNAIGMAAGIGIAAYGIIKSLADLGRTGRIISVLRKDYPIYGSLNISPALITCKLTRISSPGLRVVFTF